MCGSDELEAVAVSGLGSVYSFAVVRQAFDPAFLADVPYVVALVELDEQPGLGLMTNIVNCSAEAVKIGMRVRVVFEQREDVWIPLFEPVSA